jgi:hypothetical protein
MSLPSAAAIPDPRHIMSDEKKAETSPAPTNTHGNKFAQQNQHAAERKVEESGNADNAVAAPDKPSSK